MQCVLAGFLSNRTVKFLNSATVYLVLNIQPYFLSLSTVGMEYRLSRSKRRPLVRRPRPDPQGLATPPTRCCESHALMSIGMCLPLSRFCPLTLSSQLPKMNASHSHRRVTTRAFAHPTQRRNPAPRQIVRAHAVPAREMAREMRTRTTHCASLTSPILCPY